MDKERMFLYRDEMAEGLFKSNYQESLYRANKWIIPIMKECGITITKDGAIQFSVAIDLRKAMADYLTRKSLEGTEADLVKAMDTHKYAETRYDEKVKVVIKNIADKELEKNRMFFEKEKHDYDFSIYEDKRKSFYYGRTQEEYEYISTTAEENIRIQISQCKLGQIRDFLILEGETLKFDDTKIQEKCNVWADGKSEIQLIEKLQICANLINEIYGNHFNHIYDFGTFFETEKGFVKINSSINKKDIIEYSKNF